VANLRLRIPRELAEGEITNCIYRDVPLLDAAENMTVAGIISCNQVQGGTVGDHYGKVEGGNVNPRVIFIADGAVGFGDLVCITGWDEGNSTYKMGKADADAAKAALFISIDAVGDGDGGIALGEYLLENIDTSAGLVGAAVYLSETAGGWTLTAPDTAGDIVQQVGVVTVSDDEVGSIMFFPFYSKAIVVAA
jgi:hypothetical protein